MHSRLHVLLSQLKYGLWGYFLWITHSSAAQQAHRVVGFSKIVVLSLLTAASPEVDFRGIIPPSQPPLRRACSRWRGPEATAPPKRKIDLSADPRRCTVFVQSDAPILPRN